MANPKYVDCLQQGAAVWNAWRREHPDIEHPDLSDAQLNFVDCRSADLRGASFFRASLQDADFRGATLELTEFGRANLVGANFSGTTLRRCSFLRANLVCARLDGAQLDDLVFTQADMEGAELPRAKLVNAHMVYTKLRKANMAGVQIQGGKFQAVNFESANLESACISEADLSLSSMVGANLRGATLQDCRVFGMSVWRANLEDATQRGLQVTAPEEPSIEVDDIEVAQFVYLMLRIPNIRKVIDTITSKTVLILGRFTPERKAILDTIAEELRIHHLLPIIFDFEGSTERDLTETIKILAGMSLFVIADVSNPKSSPLELQATVPDYQIPFVTIIQEGEAPFAMLDDLKKYDWVLKPVLTYPSSELLRKAFKVAILDRAWAKHHELKKQKAEKMRTQSVEEFLGND